jgi:hypothetical protein
MLGTIIELLIGVWRGSQRRTSVRSGTADYPHPTDVFRSLLNRLVDESMQEAWADFTTDRSEAWVQVALQDKTFAVNFAFPHTGGLDEALRARGVKPPAWTCVHCEPGKAATYEAPVADAESVVTFVDALFLHFFACGSVYSVHGSIDG